MAELHALQVDRAHTGVALERTWAQGAAALVLPASAPDAQVRALLERLRPSRLVHLDTGGGMAGTRLTGGAPIGDDIALVVATSGSTGTAKGVELSHAALRASVTASLARLGARSGERWGLALPTHHIAGISVLLRAAALGTTAVVAADTAAVGDLDVEHVALVPAQLERLLAQGAAVERFTTILLGGAPAGEALLERARQAGAQVVTSYGMTETVGGCVYDGRPLDDVEVAVDAASARIRIRGPVLLEGYRSLTGTPVGAEGYRSLTGTPVDAEGWFTTPDLGRLDAEGRLEVTGRADDVLISGGENVPLAAVSALLRSHPAVADVTVAAVADDRWGQVPAAVVVPTAAQQPPRLSDLQAHVRAHAPAAYAPGHLLLVDHLPRDGLGKLPAAEVSALLVAEGLTPT